MKMSDLLCSNEISMQPFQMCIGIANLIHQADMRLVNQSFELFIGHCTGIFVAREPASHVGLDHHLDVRNGGSNLARILHCFPSTQFVERHAVKRMNRSDERRTEMEIPYFTEIAGIVCCGRRSQDANLAPHAVDNRPAAFFDAIFVELIQIKGAFARSSCLVSTVKVRRHNSSDRTNSLDPARCVRACRRSECADRAIKDIGQDAYRGEKSDYGDRKSDSYIFDYLCLVHACLQFLRGHVSAARVVA